MGTIFESILQRTTHAYFVWEDDLAVAFLDINPRTTGHTLVIPRLPISHWLDLPDDLSAHLFWVGKQIGRAQMAAFDCARAGLVVAGYHVPHVHLHVFPTNSMEDFDFRSLPSPGEQLGLEQSMCDLRSALKDLGFGDHVPDVA